MQVVKKEKKEVMPLDQVKDLVHAVLLQQKAGQNAEGQTALQQQLRDFQTASTVKIGGPQYAALAQEITHPAPPPARPRFRRPRRFRRFAACRRVRDFLC